MKKLKIFIILIILSLIQSFFGHYIRIGSIMPDVMFVFVVGYALLCDDIKSVLCVSAIFGITADCLSGRIFGDCTAVYMISAALGFIMSDSIFKDGVVFNIICVFLLTVIGKSGYYLINIVDLKESGYLYSLGRIIFPEAVYNTVVSPVIFPVVKRVLGKRRRNIR